jgi:uncharacterized protein (TIGR03086 family)
VADLYDGPSLLKAATSYCLAILPEVLTEEALQRGTPCAEWDVEALLRHTVDSAVSLTQLASAGGLVLAGNDGDAPRGVSLLPRLSEQLRALAATWDSLSGVDTLLPLGDQLIWASTAAAAGAVEIAVHGWDLAQACRLDRPIPAPLAKDLLDLATRVVCGPVRHREFAHPLSVTGAAGASDQLLAFLGRDARRRSPWPGPAATGGGQT